MTDAFRATLDLSGRRIALIDDVITTGSTADAMATALRKVGAVEIQVWSVARTITKY
jgi:predicted amidophosphoribosyltransferase